MGKARGSGGSGWCREGTGKMSVKISRDYLGNYRGGKDLPLGGLTLHDIGELIKRAGQAAGFVVETEFRADLRPYRSRLEKIQPNKDPDKIQKDGYIDWVWLIEGDRERPVVAIETEGQDVKKDYLEVDCVKFDAAKADISVIVTFQVDKDLTLKGGPRCKREDPFVRVNEYDSVRERALLYRDSDLMKEGDVLEELIRRAQEAAANRRRPNEGSLVSSHR